MNINNLGEIAASCNISNWLLEINKYVKIFLIKIYPRLFDLSNVSKTQHLLKIPIATINLLR